MQIGVVFPQTEIGADRGALRSYAEAVEEAGYAHILAYDHVLGADPRVHEGWKGPYTHDHMFHEPFVLFGYLAAVCSLELVTGVIILPQRQAALVAKQAAEVDLLTGGRLRLGVGLGWNEVEYEALGASFASRGRRIEEQIELMRRLWTEPVVTFQGRDHLVTAAGINPLPVQRPIPVWMGAWSAPALRRVGRVADGFIALTDPGPALDKARDTIAAGAAEVGRDAGAIGIEGRVQARHDQLEKVAEDVSRWRHAGATHLCVNTMNGGFSGVDAHISALTDAARSLDLGKA